MTVQEVKKCTAVFFAWQDDEEEKWLEKMAAEGWQLSSVAPFVYTFRRGTPQTVVYRMDYMSSSQKDYTEYLTIFRDAGWELAATLSNWHYFRSEPQNNAVPEIYNSNRTKAQKYRRLLFSFIPFMPIFVVMLSRVSQIHGEHSARLVDWIYFAATLLMAGILVLWAFSS